MPNTDTKPVGYGLNWPFIESKVVLLIKKRVDAILLIYVKL